MDSRRYSVSPPRSTPVASAPRRAVDAASSRETAQEKRRAKGLCCGIEKRLTGAVTPGGGAFGSLIVV